MLMNLRYGCVIYKLFATWSSHRHIRMQLICFKGYLSLVNPIHTVPRSPLLTIVIYPVCVQVVSLSCHL